MPVCSATALASLAALLGGACGGRASVARRSAHSATSRVGSHPSLAAGVACLVTAELVGRSGRMRSLAALARDLLDTIAVHRREATATRASVLGGGSAVAALRDVRRLGRIDAGTAGLLRVDDRCHERVGSDGRATDHLAAKHGRRQTIHVSARNSRGGVSPSGVSVARATGDVVQSPSRHRAVTGGRCAHRRAGRSPQRSPRTALRW